MVLGSLDSLFSGLNIFQETTPHSHPVSAKQELNSSNSPVASSVSPVVEKEKHTNEVLGNASTQPWLSTNFSSIFSSSTEKIAPLVKITNVLDDEEKRLPKEDIVVSLREDSNKTEQGRPGALTKTTLNDVVLGQNRKADFKLSLFCFLISLEMYKNALSGKK